MFKIISVLFYFTLFIPSYELLTCAPECLTCSLTDASLCTSCSSLMFVTSGTCKCKDGYYNTGSLIACSQCDSTCVTCTGASSSSCTSCDSTSFLYQNTCYQNCSSSSYFNTTSLTCRSCDPNCLTCNGPSSQSCTSCASGTLTSGSCLCSSTQYKDSSTYICTQCDASCATCNGPSSSSCTSCSSTSFLYQNKCYQNCNSSSYFNTTSLTCNSCDPNCLTCNGPSSQSCTSCASGTLTSGSCLCSSTQYKNSSTYTCTQCDASCATCNGPYSSNCTSCNSASFLYKNACYQNCSSSSYFNTTSLACQSCDPNCLTCNGASPQSCTSCASGTLTDGSCQCDLTQYKDSTTYSCQSCDNACLTCSGPYANNCTSCNSNQMLQSGICSCQGTTYLNLNIKSCVPCDSTCNECNGPSAYNCTSCKNNLKLSQSGNCICNISTYFNSSSISCLACESTCKECTGPSNTDCISCLNNLTLSATQASCTCTGGYYLNFTQLACSPCHSSCQTCSGSASSQCTACTTNKLLSNNYCLDICASDQYRLENGSCAQCHSSCAQCSGPLSTSCSSCPSPYNLINGQCIASTCSTGCLTCRGSSASECTSCIDSYAFLQMDSSTGNLGQCVLNCPSLYYVLEQNGMTVCNHKAAINSQLTYGSDSSNVKIMLSDNANFDHNTLITQMSPSITFRRDQPVISYNYSLQQSSSPKSVTVLFFFDGHLLPGNTLAIDWNDLRNDNTTNFYMLNTHQQLSLLEYYTYSDTVQNTVAITSKTTTVSFQANNVFSSVSAFLMRSVHSMRSEVVQDLLSYFIYMNIDYPPNYVKFVNTNISLLESIFPNIGSSIYNKINNLEPLSTSSIEISQIYDQQSYSYNQDNALGTYGPTTPFLVTYGAAFAFLVILLFVIIATEVTRWHLKKKNFSKHILNKLVVHASFNFRWNYLLNQFFGGYLDLMFNSFFEVCNPPTFNKTFHYLDFTASIIGLTISVVGLFAILVYSRRVYRVAKSERDKKARETPVYDEACSEKKDEEEEKKVVNDFLKRSEMLYEPFNSNRQMQLFYPFVLIFRNFGFALVIVLLQKYPLVQALYIASATLVVILYLLKFQPMDERFQQNITVLYECILFIACMLAVTIHVYSQKHITDIDTRSNLGFAIIACNLFMLILNFTNMTIELNKLRKKLFKPKPKIGPMNPDSINIKALMAESQPAKRAYIKRKTLKTSGFMRILTYTGLRKMNEHDIYKQNDDSESQNVSQGVPTTPTRHVDEIDWNPTKTKNLSKEYLSNLGQNKLTPGPSTFKKMNKIAPIHTNIDMNLEKSENKTLLSHLNFDSKSLTINTSISIDSKSPSPLASPSFFPRTLDSADLSKKITNDDDEEKPTAKSFSSVKRFALVNRSLQNTKNTMAKPEAQSCIVSNHHHLKTKNSNLKDVILAIKKQKIERIEEDKEESEQTKREDNRQNRQQKFKGIMEGVLKTRANDSRDLSDNKKEGGDNLLSSIKSGE